jgi:hypothetical protein
MVFMSTNIDPAVCGVESHLDRPGKSRLLDSSPSCWYKDRSRDSAPLDLLSGLLRVCRMSVHVYPADDRMVIEPGVPAP